ncbi:MAG: protoporphyrinogen oxidase [Elusimicrobia bacterium]|nr:protoporphyrinogen oxidase [Elusimicrobiota bacterium]
MSRVVVVGGGIAGLACAYRLAKAGAEVVLLEAAPRLGGKILSEKVGSVTFEGGPDSFITSKPVALELTRELGLEERLLPTGDVDRDVFVYSRGRLRRYPDGLMLMAPAEVLPFLASDLVGWRTKLRMGLDLLLPRGGAGDESLGAFTRRRFGGEALEVVVAPIMAGIFAGDPDRLSLAATFPKFPELEQRWRSVILGLRADRARRAGLKAAAAPARRVTMFMAMSGGLETLTAALAARLPAGAVRLRAPAESLTRTGDRWVVRAKGEEHPADAVVLAVPASAAARLTAGLDPALSAELASVRYVSTATVTLSYPAGTWGGRLRGFGFVVDRREIAVVTAATFSTSKFPGRAPDGTEVLRLFLGGWRREEMVDWTDERILAGVRADLRRILGADPEPAAARVYRWPAANPQYVVGHQALVARLEERLGSHPGLLLAGSSYKGVGIPDCARSGTEAARLALELKGGVA